MSRHSVAVTGVAVILGLTLACTSNSSTPLTPAAPATSGTSSTASDGSTLKVTAPVPQSPIGGVRPSTGPATLVINSSTASFAGSTPLQYRFQVFNGANALVQDSGLLNATSYAVAAELVANASYTWQARAEYQGSVGPWSSKASFLAPETAFLGVSEFADPLTNGKTVGIQHGGHFTPGQGWSADSLTGGIDYDLQQPCTSCTLEFDVTNFGKAEGLPVEKDLKWITMGDATAFGDFGAFRNHPWKMHLEQRSDGDGTGMKITWRNGGFGEGEPGDHVIKADPAVNWNSNQVFHFKFIWDGGGFGVFVNGEEWFGAGFSQPYAPTNHRVSLGCWPRAESFPSAIYRNVKLRKN